MSFSTPNWPTPEQLKKPITIVPSIPLLMGRRAFLPPIGKDHTFQEPVKKITDQSLMAEWEASEAWCRLIDYIQTLNHSVKNCKISHGAAQPRSGIVNRIVALLDELDSWIDLLPPDTSSQSRFGNITFRLWMDKLNQNVQQLHLKLFEDLATQDLNYTDSIQEISFYLTGAFGDGTRIDYGSGHELSFIAWLCCLDLVEITKTEDYNAIVLVVFVRYLDLVRKLQKTYNLEPAGSHGVWGLDDYQFLPYLFGSSQLLDHKKIKPKSIADKDIVDYFSKEYLYLACIQFIHENKRGPFHEHSPILFDISGVQLWSKVNSGMMKMYIAEVLLKFPVVQHFLFGSLLSFTPALDITPPDVMLPLLSDAPS